jgi:hypothetical protein
MVVTKRWKDRLSLAVLHDPVIRAGRNQQRNNTHHRKERNSVQIAQTGGKFLVAIAENRQELETEQDLRTEDQYPRLVQSKFDFLVSSMHPALKAI